MAAPFESFINHVMSKQDTADKLRQITYVQQATTSSYNYPISSSRLSDSVNSMLVEQQFASQFDYNGYDSEERKQKVLEKLYEVRNKISKTYNPNHKEYMTVLLCIKYVAEGYALTPDITLYLNNLYKNV
jgi:hypothetical protein